MRRILLPVLLLATAWVAYAGAGGIPIEMVWRYGLTPSCAPTGRTRFVEGIEFVEIGAGTFVMGSNANGRLPDSLGSICGPLGLPWGDPGRLSDEMPVHRVEFHRPYWIARCELTNEQYERFDPDHGRTEFSPGDRTPVVNVSFEDAQAYCDWLAKASGFPVRLPSEAEWEAAIRGGSRSEFCSGNDEAGLGEYAWYRANSGGRAHEVGTRRANAWGIHGLAGNVGEWCEDVYACRYGPGPADGRPIVTGGTTIGGNRARVLRGGTAANPAATARSAQRQWCVQSQGIPHLGVRLAIGPLDD